MSSLSCKDGLFMRRLGQHAECAALLQRMSTVPRHTLEKFMRARGLNTEGELEVLQDRAFRAYIAQTRPQYRAPRHDSDFVSGQVPPLPEDATEGDDMEVSLVSGFEGSLVKCLTTGTNAEATLELPPVDEVNEREIAPHLFEGGGEVKGEPAAADGQNTQWSAAGSSAVTGVGTPSQVNPDHQEVETVAEVHAANEAGANGGRGADLSVSRVSLSRRFWNFVGELVGVGSGQAEQRGAGARIASASSVQFADSILQDSSSSVAPPQAGVLPAAPADASTPRSREQPTHEELAVAWERTVLETLETAGGNQHLPVAQTKTPTVSGITKTTPPTKPQKKRAGRRSSSSDPDSDSSDSEESDSECRGKRDRAKKKQVPSKPTNESSVKESIGPPRRLNGRPADAVGAFRAWNLKFAGTSRSGAERFLKKLKKCVKWYNLPDEEVLSALDTVFTDKAEGWLSNNEDEWESVAEFVADFRQQYCREIDREDLLDELRRRTQGEDELFCDYLNNFQSIVRYMRPPPSAGKQLKLLQLGLRPEYRRYLETKEVEDLRDLRYYCDKYEKARARDKKWQPPPPKDDMLVPEAAYVGKAGKKAKGVVAEIAEGGSGGSNAGRAKKKKKSKNGRGGGAAAEGGDSSNSDSGQAAAVVDAVAQPSSAAASGRGGGAQVPPPARAAPSLQAAAAAQQQRQQQQQRWQQPQQQQWRQPPAPPQGQMQQPQQHQGQQQRQPPQQWQWLQPQPRPPRGPGQGAAGAGAGKGRTCFRCGGKGHIANECPSDPTPQGDRGACYKCQQVGHFANRCPLNDVECCQNCNALNCTFETCRNCEQIRQQSGNAAAGSGGPWLPAQM